MQHAPITPKPTEAPRRGWFSFRNPYLFLSAGLALAGPAIYHYGLWKGYHRGRQEVTNASRFPQTEVVENLRQALAYWKEKEAEGNPRLLGNLKLFLARRGIALEPAMEIEIRARVGQLEVGKNVLAVAGKLGGVSSGAYIHGHIVEDLAILVRALPDSPLLEEEREMLARKTMAHEILHHCTTIPLTYLVDLLGSLEGVSPDCAEAKEWWQAKHVLEEFTEYLTMGVFEELYNPRVSRVSLGFGLSTFSDQLLQDPPTLDAMLKLFFVPAGERAVRTSELDRTLAQLHNHPKKDESDAWREGVEEWAGGAERLVSLPLRGPF